MDIEMCETAGERWWEEASWERTDVIAAVMVCVDRRQHAHISCLLPLRSGLGQGLSLPPLASNWPHERRRCSRPSSTTARSSSSAPRMLQTPLVPPTCSQ